jgi:hypothetical protein
VILGTCAFGGHYSRPSRRHTWEAGIRAGTIKLRGVRSSAKIATGQKHQGVMRAAGGGTRCAARPGGAEGGTPDDEFAPPLPAAIARMEAAMRTTPACEL